MFTAATLLLVLGSALFMDALGLSMALGTSSAGVLLAESEYRDELEMAIDPLKACCSVCSYSLWHVAEYWGVYPSVVGSDSVVVLVAVKLLVLYLLARLYGVRSSERMQFAGVLSRAVSLPCPLFYRLLHNVSIRATRWRCCW
ncbi:hypothetical protein ACNKHL_20280 [Shigella flexneri]